MGTPVQPAQPPSRITVELEVPFHDLDPLQVVWHGHYYKYLELARTQLQRAHRIDVPDLQGLGYGLFVYETRCRHTSPLRYGDRVQVEAWLHEVGVRMCVRYRVRNSSTGRGAARATTALAFTDPEGRMLSELPDELARRLAVVRPTPLAAS